MAYVIFNLLCVAVLIGIDQGIKFWAVHVLMPVGTLPLIPHVVELRFVLNQGMAFSLLSGRQLFLIVATSAALILVAYWLLFRSRNNRLQQAALILVLGGQLLFHSVEGFDVLQLPLYGFLAGKAHRQQAEPVPVHQVLRELLTAILERGLVEKFSSRIFGH